MSIVSLSSSSSSLSEDESDEYEEIESDEYVTSGDGDRGGGVFPGVVGGLSYVGGGEMVLCLNL